MRFFFVPVLLFLAYLSSFAQEKNYSTTNKKAINYYLLARPGLDDKINDEAVAQLLKAIAEDSRFIEAYLKLADIYRQEKNFKQAIDQYRKAIKINPDFNRFTYFKLGECEIRQAQYAEANRDLEKYLAFDNIPTPDALIAKKLLNDCKFSLDAIKHPVEFKPINLGPAINTSDNEYFPAVTADENTIIFTRKVNNNEDFYQSVKVNGQWQTATYLSAKINTSFNEGALSLSPDGKILFFTGCNRPDGLGRCDIYITEKKGSDWSKPYDITPPINTTGWESQPSISSDGRTLYFVSNRKGGYGGYDIWRSTISEKGWSAPQNLGPNINTSYDEQSPFIHPDDSTLYFASNGWPGMGGKDLFVSRLGKDGQWQKPQNLGYPINSSGDENGLALTSNGIYAFFSSNNLKGLGGADIYTFVLPENIRPRQVNYVKGTVNDAITKQPLKSAVEIVDLKTGKPVYQDYSSEEQGDFLATLKTGRNYGLNISKNGYLFYSANFSLVGAKNKQSFNLTVLLQPIEVGNKVILQNIFFNIDKSDIKDESKSELKKLKEFLDLNPTVRVEVSGHTDNTGTSQHNKTLSEDRAKAVYQYLIDNGVDAQRMVYAGYGETQPVASNNDEENRSKNRRTEFKIIAK